jgi:hypothetical protein
VTSLESFGNILCAVPESLSALILVFSWSVYGGGGLSACPLTHVGTIFVCLAFCSCYFATSITSASSLDWSKTPLVSKFQILSSVDALSHPYSISFAFQLYALTIILYIANVAIVPKTSVLYKAVSWILPSVGPFPSMMVDLSSSATIHPR